MFEREPTSEKGVGFFSADQIKREYLEENFQNLQEK